MLVVEIVWLEYNPCFAWCHPTGASAGRANPNCVNLIRSCARQVAAARETTAHSQGRHSRPSTLFGYSRRIPATFFAQGSNKMPGHKQHTLPTFQRFVEVGRVVLINDPSSPANGKLATIVEIVDHGRALIDGPTTSVPRQSVAFRRVILTPFVIKGLPRGARSATVGKAFEKAEVSKKWEASGWKRNIDARAIRRSLTDFQRFEVMLLKRQRRDIIGKGLVKAKRAQA
ncbi:hypothetical protein O181_057058 [Austropuccinia psidii MF-1]|uniref:Large ribosomal subunit protein eL14 domain-containing protein n=1 Tax=Austropuccinia psidii MF-1 TaxID=1389203 RepID=A0A9Q3HU34_9BASI|nr:hypothetical protein [Austropuccinia psidii MF-1]